MVIQNIMQAQDLKGVLYLHLSEVEQQHFEEIRNTMPSDKHKEWLYRKLTRNMLSYTGKNKGY